jgi:dihydrofolate reductase
MSVSIIVAMDKAGGIGKDNGLLCHLSKDLKYFKKITTGHTIVMGYNTYLSIGKPLPNRRNVVLSTKKREASPNIIFYTSLQECLEKEGQEGGELMIIGGGRLYQQAMSIADKLYITRIHHTFEADTFFPEFDAKLWQLESERFEPKDDKTPYDLSFEVYTHP